jgi:NADPH-dependent 2,4-dienoyl-CoA reductase/sulfur reductase-like enzyme/rhodanese-related sulfurtransferase
MRIIIIGAVAAGTSAAAKARRNNEDADIIIYEKDSFISYSGCGMPYYIGGEVVSADDLIPRNTAFFKSKYNVDVLTMHQVLSITPDENSVQVKNLTTGEVFTDIYDRLILATGAAAIVPPIKGVENNHVFTLRNINDMNRIKTYLDNKHPQTAVILGTGFIGLEVCENLKKLGLDVIMIEKQPLVTPVLDPDMAVYLNDCLTDNSVTLLTNTTVTEITEDTVILSDNKKIPADLVLIAAGISPNIELAESAGIILGTTGAIQVSNTMQTNVENIYACGDCIQQYHVVTGKPVYRPLGSTANKTGRIAGDSVTGGNLTFRGILGTGILGIFDMTVAVTGLSELEAVTLGFDVEVCHNIKPNKPEYMGGKEMVIKGIADKANGRLLGIQIIGYEGVDKRIDVFATAITYNAKVEDLFHLDLAYAPPFSTTKDPVLYTGMILDNAIQGGRPLMTAQKLDALIETGENINLIDARIASQYETSHITKAQNIPHTKLRTSVNDLDPNAITVTYCNKGVTGNAAQNILIGKGFHKVFNLSGGHKQYKKMQNRLAENE